MTHGDLVKIADKWLRNKLRCRVVLCELVAYTESGETPDAIGWKMGFSILVECKTSHADFLADLKKRSRSEYVDGMGDFRFYLTPPGIIKPDELPKGWGLYEVIDSKVSHAAGVEWSNAKGAPFFTRTDCRSEVAMLVSKLARIREAHQGGKP